MKKNYSYFLTFAAIVNFLGGCSTLTSPGRSKSLDANRDVAYWFDYDATRRGAVMIPRKKESGNAEYVICSEPAPDVALQSILDLSNTLKVKTGNIDVSNDTKLEVTQNVVKLAERTQMVQFLRESLFRLCEMSINSRISASSVESIYVKILEIALRLNSPAALDLDLLREKAKIAGAEYEQKAAQQNYREKDQERILLLSTIDGLKRDIQKSKDAKNEDEIKSLRATLADRELELSKVNENVAAAKRNVDDADTNVAEVIKAASAKASGAMAAASAIQSEVVKAGSDAPKAQAP